MTEIAKIGTELTVHWDEFERLCGEKGWTNDPQRAAGLGLGYQTLRHIRTGYLSPGGIFLRRCLAVFGSTAYDRLFEATG